MSFPTSPTNGQQYTNDGGSLFQYDLSQDRWFKVNQAPNYYRLGKNLLINGDFQIDQRRAGAAVTINSGAAWTYCMDHWRALGQTADGVFTVQQVTSSVPASGAKYATKITVTTADAAIGASQIYLFLQSVEGQMASHLMWGTSNAKKVTLSFWIRSSLTGTFSGSLNNADASKSYPFTFTISVADTWEKKSIVVSGCTDGTWLTTNGVGIHANFDLGCGSTYRTADGAWASGQYWGVTGAVQLIGTLNATLYLADVQLEMGESVTDFERVPHDHQLRRCQRYYETNAADGAAPVDGLSVGVYLGLAATSNTHYTNIPFKVQKRVAPTAFYFYRPTYGGTAGRWAFYSSGGAWTDFDGAPSLSTSSEHYATIYSTYAVGLPFHYGYLVSGVWACDVEL